MRIPVVCSRLETLAAHFSDEEIVFFEPGNRESLAAALRAVAGDRRAAEARVEAAAARYHAYRWPVQAGRYLSVIAPERGAPARSARAAGAATPPPAASSTPTAR